MIPWNTVVIDAMSTGPSHGEYGPCPLLVTRGFELLKSMTMALASVVAR